MAYAAANEAWIVDAVRTPIGRHGGALSTVRPDDSKQCAQAHGLAPLAKTRSVGAAGVPPRVMGIGSVFAMEKALRRAGISLDEVGPIELNEAFAAQSLAVLYEWGMDPEDERLNRNGDRAVAPSGSLGRSHAYHPRARDGA